MIKQIVIMIIKNKVKIIKIMIKVEGKNKTQVEGKE